MTAKQYNYTKQNDVVKKARKRFTKQNGVVKQILAGWTKRNGVVEQVYASSVQPKFATFIDSITSEYGNDVFAVSANDAVLYDANAGYDNAVLIQNDFWSEGPIVDVRCGLRPYYLSYNYAENSLIGSKTYSEKELLLSDPYAPAAYSRYGGNIRAPIKIGNVDYIGYESTYNSSTAGYDTKLVEFSDTAKTNKDAVASASNFSSGLCLYEGRGVCLVRQVSTTSNTNDTKTFVLYDYDHSASNKVSYSTVVSIVGGTGASGNISTGVFTTNGQDCFFTVNWNYHSGHDYSYLCKYNTQTKTLTKVALGRGRTIVGTYNGFVYVLAVSDSADEFLVVEKYNLSLELVGTHAIPAQTNKTKPTIDSQPFMTTVNSNSRYVAFYSSSERWYCVLDLDLF